MLRDLLFLRTLCKYCCCKIFVVRRVFICHWKWWRKQISHDLKWWCWRWFYMPFLNKGSWCLPYFLLEVRSGFGKRSLNKKGVLPDTLSSYCSNTATSAPSFPQDWVVVPVRGLWPYCSLRLGWKSSTCSISKRPFIFVTAKTKHKNIHTECIFDYSIIYTI